MIERKIVVGLITSTEFIQQIHRVWNIHYMKAGPAKRLAGWCITYFEKYNKAPQKNIQDLVNHKQREGLPDEIANDIEDILYDLNKDFTSGELNLDYLLDQTYAYFKQRQIEMHLEDVQALLDDNELLEAERSVLDYQPMRLNSETDLDLNSREVLLRVDKAFAETEKPLFKYPGAFGDFINAQLVRSGFIAFMGSEKRGKSYILLDMAIEAAKNNLQVAFFQAGDMTENAQLKRIGSYLTGKPLLKKHEGKQYFPVEDCELNQNDTCARTERVCNFGFFDEEETEKVPDLDNLIKLYKENPDYKPCTVCKKWNTQAIGAVWIKKKNVGNVVTVNEAKGAFKKNFVLTKRKFKLSTHPNSSLSVDNIKTILSTWEKEDNFSPDVLVVDYADLLVVGSKVEFRHQQNEIWRALRGLSQEKHCLLITATQADAKSYTQDKLNLSNYSEDKRKYAHVTAMFGLNQDKNHKEKRVGVMRINELVIRESDFSATNQVTILQNIRIGKPFLGSFWK